MLAAPAYFRKPLSLGQRRVASSAAFVDSLAEAGPVRYLTKSLAKKEFDSRQRDRDRNRDPDSNAMLSDDDVNVRDRGPTAAAFSFGNLLNGPTFEDLPPEILASIAHHMIPDSPSDVLEVRACNCLSLKRFPFRGGETKFFHDQESRYDVRKDIEPCRFDRKGGLGKWCLKQDLTRRPGARHSIPTFAVMNKLLWRKWRDATIYVFCAESCLADAIRALPAGNKKLMTRVRFFERDNKRDTLYQSREAYATGLSGWDATLTYENQEGMREIVYRGMKVHVKDMVLLDA